MEIRGFDEHLRILVQIPQSNPLALAAAAPQMHRPLLVSAVVACLIACARAAWQTLDGTAVTRMEACNPNRDDLLS